MIEFINKHKKMLIIIGLVIFTQLIMAVVVGSRDVSTGHDTYRYAELYEALKDCLCFDGGVEQGFQVLTIMFAYAEASNEGYFIGLSACLFVLVILASYQFAELFSNSFEKYNQEYWQLIYLVLLIFLWSPFYVSAHINAIRQGLASFMVFLALFAFILRNWRLFLLSTVTAMSFHHTALMYIAFFPLLMLRVNHLILVVLVLSISYAFGVSEAFVAWISNALDLGLYEKISNYQLQIEYERGIRYDFLVFSWLMGLSSYLIYNFLSTDKYKRGMAETLKIYFLLLIPFLLFGYATFSNRFLYTTWLFLPFLAASTLGSIRVWRKWNKYPIYILSITSPFIFIFMVLNGIAR